jgi:hypothetical protein
MLPLHRTINIISLVFICSFQLTYAQDEFDDIFEPKTTIGGYGELHYNYEKTGNEKSKEILDFHRFVIYFGHAWSEKWSFRSEVELEHNYVKGGQGELQLEQAFLNYTHSPYLSLQAGVLLVASSFINEYHEPVFFMSVERPEYAKYIIPTTWFGNGIGASGFFNGLDYRLVVMESLDGSKVSMSSGIRDARQKGFKSNAEELLYNFRLDYVSIPGLRIGGSIVTTDAVVDDSTKNTINIWEIHALYQSGGMFAAFEYGDISYQTCELNRSKGYYLDLGYNVGYPLNWKVKLYPWFRWTDYNTAAETIMGGSSEKMYHFRKWLAGLTLLPEDNVVLKAEYGYRERVLDGQKTELFNLGIGYNFQ